MFEVEGAAAADVPEVRRRIFLAFFLVVIGGLTVFFACQGVWKPAGEGLGTWVTRSGAVLTIAALLADLLLSDAVPRLTNPLRERYLELIVLLKRITFSIVILGTVVWAYGDLILGIFFS